MVRSKGMLLAISTFTLFQLITHVGSLAIFETQVLAFSNPTNRIASGQCCQSPASSTCHLNCLTFFEVCLDDLHLKEPSCTFGKNKSEIYQTSSLTINETSLDGTIPISTSLSWPGIFGLRISAIDNSTRTSTSNGLIQKIGFVDKITPANGWKTKNASGPVSSFVYRYRVICAPNYFGLNCTIYCQPRDDSHGHYGCDLNGIRYCLNGWNDIADYCRKPICNETCQHGRCTGPNICSCDRGWIGSLCSTCQTRVGCVNGTCTTPGGCNCNTGWGGTNCDKEMDYCGMHKPCQNGGTCINNGLGAFRCYCRLSYTGQRCEAAITACTSKPCLNGGSCQVVGNGYKCICRPEYTGTQCGTKYDPCAYFQCQNNGTCNATHGQPSCNCWGEFTGQRCETILRLTTSQAITKSSTKSKTHTDVYRSILPSDSLSPSITLLLTSYQPKTTEITPSIHTLQSSDIDQDISSVNSYRNVWNFTHTSFGQISTVYSQTSSILSQSTKRLLSTMPYFSPNRTVLFTQSAASVISLFTTKLFQSSTYELQSTVPSKTLLSHPASRPSTASVLYTRSIEIDRNHTPVFRRDSISARIDEESRIIIPSADFEVDQSAPSTMPNPWVFSTDILSPTATNVLSASISSSTGADFVSEVPKTDIRKTQYQGSSRRSIAIGISIAISLLIIMIIGLTFLWVKFSKKRGHHKFRTASTIVPGSMNNPCKLIGAGIVHKSSSINAFGLYPSARGESTSSEKSQVVSSNDIDIDNSYLQLHSKIDSKGGYLNNCNNYSNFGYLSEGTSGYESENSSVRSSANFSSRASRSPLNANDIVVSRCSTSKGPSGDLPNCIAYLEEYQEVEL